MISFSGKVWGLRRSSYVYAVVQGSYVYFGETGEVPPGRWGQHLGAGGTFARKLVTEDDEGTIADQQIVFIGIRCLVVDNEKPAYQKIARRAIEEELHRQFNLNSGALGEDLTLVSQPPPPAVRRQWTFEPREVARQIYVMLVDEYKIWRSSVMAENPQ
jgi:hypothetical protein